MGMSIETFVQGLQNLSKASALTVLNASDNKLSCLPEAELEMCERLRLFDISNNDLSDLPSSLGSLETVCTM